MSTFLEGDLAGLIAGGLFGWLLASNYYGRKTRKATDRIRLLCQQLLRHIELRQESKGGE